MFRRHWSQASRIEQFLLQSKIDKARVAACVRSQLRAEESRMTRRIKSALSKPECRDA
jgi:hypothetical protein